MRSKKRGFEKRKILSAVVAAIAIGLILWNINSIFGLLSSVFTAGNTGVVKSPNIEVYWESECINETSSIDWGMLRPGETKDVTIYINNTGNIPLTLHMSLENWDPESAKDYVSLDWNYTGGEIQPNEVLPITLTIQISQNITDITNFRFDIFIIGTEIES